MAREATLILSRGRKVQLRMPNMYELMATSSGAANPQTADILRLLEGAEALPMLNLLQRQAALMEYYRGLYELARLCLVSPRLVLSGTPGPGEIGPDDLTWGDVYRIYNHFFWNDEPAPYLGGPGGVALAPTHQPEGDAAAARAGDDVPHAAEQPA